jgi:hypothetical protein
MLTKHEKGAQSVDICRNVRLADSIVHTICDKAGRIKGSAKTGTKVFACVARLPQSYLNELHQKVWKSVPYILIALEINKYIV